MIAHLSEYTKKHLVIHLKWMDFVVCKVHLNKAFKNTKNSTGWCASVV